MDFLIIFIGKSKSINFKFITKLSNDNKFEGDLGGFLKLDMKNTRLKAIISIGLFCVNNIKSIMEPNRPFIILLLVNAAIAVMSELKEQCEQLKSVLTQLSAHLGIMTLELKSISDRQNQKQIMKRTLQTIKKAIMGILTKFGLSIPEWLKRLMKVNFQKFSESEKNHLLKVVSLAKTTKNLMETDLLSDEGTVPIESKDALKTHVNFFNNYPIK